MLGGLGCKTGVSSEVAVRVRPLSDKEIKEGGTECVEAGPFLPRPIAP